MLKNLISCELAKAERKKFIPFILFRIMFPPPVGDMI